VVRIELRVADEVAAGVILELDSGSWYDPDAGDDAGADSDARPGGNGRGGGQILWITSLTLPPGHPRSWFLLLSFLPLYIVCV